MGTGSLGHGRGCCGVSWWLQLDTRARLGLSPRPSPPPPSFSWSKWSSIALLLSISAGEGTSEHGCCPPVKGHFPSPLSPVTCRCCSSATGVAQQ